MDPFECEYIELESVIRDQRLAPLQRRTSEVLVVDPYEHLCFVYKMYITSFFLVAAVGIQWFFVTEVKFVQKIVIIYNYYVLIVVFLHFILLTFIKYVLKHKQSKLSKRLVCLYMFLLIELGSVALARAIVEIDNYPMIYATLTTLCMFIISLVLASLKFVDTLRAPKHLCLWSMKYFLATTICLLMTMEFHQKAVQISISLFLLFFIAMFIVIWGRCVGSMQFYAEEYNYLKLYTILNYFNFLTFWINALVFFQKTLVNTFETP